ncbi:hypothetical protein Slin15195_G122240 [Septoria linicola]|uniref:Uncharacterized protein n=1 Tax=Septoria linicola TaxID=215465 RepID=A0A9Q9EQA0_9PEZI|nr:hypothetical protein Slin14017_G078440 [Septoria linicola]USW58905.1 hypothetical protein Slin15195_G122240 [Septoria linicola]
MLLTTILIAAASAHALPRSTTSKAPLPAYFLLANGTRTDFWRAPETLTEVIHSGPQRRQAGRTDVEIGPRDVIAQDLNAGPDEFPQAFSQLFDNVDSSLCSQLGCNSGAEYCVTAATGADVCIKATGAFERQARGAFIRSARGSFDRAVRRQRPGQGVIEIGPDFVHFQAREGSLGIGDLRVNLRNADSSGDGASCPSFISAIAAGGALFPNVATPFGALSFLCGAVDSFSGTASG